LSNPKALKTSKETPDLAAAQNARAQERERERDGARPDGEKEKSDFKSRLENFFAMDASVSSSSPSSSG